MEVVYVIVALILVTISYKFITPVMTIVNSVLPSPFKDYLLLAIVICILLFVISRKD